MVHDRTNPALVYDEVRLAMYVFGGCARRGNSLSNAETYSLARGEWRGLPKMPSVKGSLQTCRHQTAVYLMDDSKDIDIFYPSSCSYSTFNMHSSPIWIFNLIDYKDKLCIISREKLIKWDLEEKHVETLELAQELKLTDLVVRDGKWCYLLQYRKMDSKVEGWRLDLESAEVMRLK